MASKGQKFKKYTEEFINDILTEYKTGEGSIRSLAFKYSISPQTIKTWVRRYINHPELNLLKGKRGRPRKDNTEIDYKERYEILKKYQAFIEAQRGKK